MYSFCRRQYATNSDIPVEGEGLLSKPYEKCRIETKKKITFQPTTSLYLGEYAAFLSQTAFMPQNLKGRILKPSQ